MGEPYYELAKDKFETLRAFNFCMYAKFLDAFVCFITNGRKIQYGTPQSNVKKHCDATRKEARTEASHWFAPIFSFEEDQESTRPREQPRRREQLLKFQLLKIYFCSDSFKFLLHFFSVFLSNAFFNYFWSAFNEVFCFFQAETSDCANFFNDVNFVIAT